ncbi:hypothetical protein PLESTB_001781900 [Pleodorina starrii]|uniref:Uncharacterized protein n=1 Tax=Pleodorina starrii TaxID=330485 RepID=A0A9W6FAE6_9CHLO|nr:hypothetical protein PLESTB_001781900 [Pleodorina starrii]
MHAYCHKSQSQSYSPKYQYDAAGGGGGDGGVLPLLPTLLLLLLRSHTSAGRAEGGGANPVPNASAALPPSFVKAVRAVHPAHPNNVSTVEFEQQEKPTTPPSSALIPPHHKHQHPYTNQPNPSLRFTSPPTTHHPPPTTHRHLTAHPTRNQASSQATANGWPLLLLLYGSVFSCCTTQRVPTQCAPTPPTPPPHSVLPAAPPSMSSPETRSAAFETSTAGDQRSAAITRGGVSPG